MRRPPRTLLLWTAALAVAALTAGVVGSDLAALHRRAGSLGPQVQVLVAAHDLPLGSTLRGADVRAVARHRSQVPADALTDVARAEGRVVAVPAVAGTVLVTRQIVPARRGGLDGVLPRGRRALRVPDPDGLRPRPGSRIDVLATFDPALLGSGADPTGVVARGALVLDGRRDRGDGSRPTVLVMVAEADAPKLAFALANATVALALAPPDDGG
jgi:Flp pilus assembly protein CpaB